MNLLVSFFLNIVLVLAPCIAPAESKQPLKRNDFTTWPGASVQGFGCFLERDFGHKDKKFNCALKQYLNSGDPCKNTDAYYEGPIFPDLLAKKVSDKIESIDTSWEHGNLQAISITFNKKYSDSDLRRWFKLTAGASIQDCAKAKSCVVLFGFDHMGAGDVDCSER